MADMKKALAQWDAADELLAEKIESVEQRTVTSGELYKDIELNGTSYNELATLTLHQGEALFIKSSYFSGQPLGMRLIKVKDGTETEVAIIENETNWDAIQLMYIATGDYSIRVEIKTNKESNVKLRGYYKII